MTHAIIIIAGWAFILLIGMAWIGNYLDNQLLLLTQNQKLEMAKLADLQLSVQALKDAVSKIPVPGSGVPSVPESDLDQVKADIDQATLDVIAKIPA